MTENFKKEVRYPHIENADNRLREICFSKAKELYGTDIPEKISERLDWELKVIYIEQE